MVGRVRFCVRLAVVTMAAIVATGGTVTPVRATTTHTVTETITYEPGCSAGRMVGSTRNHFFGYLRITYRSPYPGRADYIYSVKYRIYRDRVDGGNEANVYWYDGGTTPPTRYSTSRGRQDNRWYTLGGGYYRGRGATSLKFIFDWAGRDDPSCSKYTGISN